ncbi:MAG: hypothetical protein GXX86_12115, partial [Propionibacterium sp.]|nr:hypothetical protein [Propionibacterium sp.]
MATFTRASTGIPGLDGIVDELRAGDNVVWQVDSVSAYRAVVAPFVEQALRDGREVHYARFGIHPNL